MSRPIILAVAVLVLGACNWSQSDDVARLALQWGKSQEAVQIVLEKLAKESRRTTKEVADIIVTTPPEVIPRLPGYVKNATVGVVCEALGTIVLSGPDLSREQILEKLGSVLVGAVNDEFGLFMTVKGIYEDSINGTATSQPTLWLRVTMLKIQHC